jgi:LPXTG-motif cell wall-anchored protein
MATALAAVGALVMSGGVVMLGAATAVANGNNGTLKIVNAISGLEFVDNEPKVCTFRYEGFFFDPGQTGDVVVTGQGQTDYGPSVAGSVTANRDGYFVTPEQSLESGHYKAEFQSGDDAAKFKSKVFKVNCEGNAPDPVVKPLSDQQMTCAAGVESRTGTQTTTFVWNAEKRTYDAVVGPEVWGSWTFVRALTDAEFARLGCQPGQPDPVVNPLSEERMTCDMGVEQREGTQTTTYVWNAETRTYDPVVGEEIWGEWVQVRDLTTAESLELECVAGEESIPPKPHKTRPASPQPEAKPPVVLGTEAAVPTGVDAGLASLPNTGVSGHTLLAQLMVGSGLVLLVAGGWLGFGRREYGERQL